MPGDRLGVGFVGSGFITRFHIQSFVAVRDADVAAVWSPSAERAGEAAALARALDVPENRVRRAVGLPLVEDPRADIRTGPHLRIVRDDGRLA